MEGRFLTVLHKFATESVEKLEPGQLENVILLFIFWGIFYKRQHAPDNLLRQGGVYVWSCGHPKLR